MDPVVVPMKTCLQASSQTFQKGGVGFSVLAVGPPLV